MRRLPCPLAIAWFLVMAVPTWAAEPIGRVVKQEGTTLVQRGGQPQPLANGTQVYLDDEILTGHNGRVVIEGQGGLRLVVGPGSDLRMQRWLFEPQRNRLEGVLGLVTGVLRLFVTDNTDRSVEVETRAAVASVRSTEWIVQATAANTGVFVISGRVQVTAPAGSVIVGPGLGTTVVLGGAPEPPETWGAA